MTIRQRDKLKSQLIVYVLLGRRSNLRRFFRSTWQVIESNQQPLERPRCVVWRSEKL